MAIPSAPLLWLLAGLTLWADVGLAEDWPKWRGPRGDNTWNGPPLPETWPETGLTQVWRQPLGGGYGGIAVVDGRAYVQDRQKEPEAERLVCFDAATGEMLWYDSYPVAYNNLDYGNGPRATPTIHQGRVYTFGALGHAGCWDAVTGKRLWEKSPEKDFGVKLPFWGLAASPLIVGDTVIFHPGGQPDACLVACDLVTGREVWRSGTDPGGYSTPILVDRPTGQQLVLWTPEHINGFVPKTGKLLWQVPYKVTYGVAIATPVAVEDLVFVSGYWEGSRCVRLGPGETDAKLEWEENRELRGLMCPPLYKAGHLYMLDRQFGLTCFELATGKKLWDDGNTLTPRDRNPQASLVWLDGGKSDRILGFNAEGELVLARITPQGYTETGRTKVFDHTWAHPAFAGECVYVRSDEAIACIRLK